MPAGDGVWRVWTFWRVWTVLEGLVPLQAHRKLCCGLGPGVPVGEVALALGCLLGTVFGGFGRFGGCGRFSRVFGGFVRFWRVWGVWRVLEGVWRVWRVLERLESFGAFGVFAGWQTAALKANRKPLLWPWPRALAPGCLFEKWPWPWGACGGRCLEGFGGCLEGLDGFGGFGEFWSVCGLANGSFESQ